MNEQTNELKEVLDIKFEMVLKRGLYEKSEGVQIQLVYL